jgi:hypothetical protein
VFGLSSAKVKKLTKGVDFHPSAFTKAAFVQYNLHSSWGPTFTG